MSEKTYYDKDDNVIKKVFTIPVDSLSREDAEKQIKNLMNSYSQEFDLTDEDYKLPENMLKDNDIWFPTRQSEESDWGQFDYMTEEDIWNELSESEKKERLLSKEERDEIFKKTGFMDWNELSLDQLADYLDDKWRFSSSGDALAIHKLIEFYRKNKDKV